MEHNRAQLGMGVSKLLKQESGRRGSNPRRPAWEAGRRTALVQLSATVFRRATQPKLVVKPKPEKLKLAGRVHFFLYALGIKKMGPNLLC
jgi:hypothetical protein